MLPEVAPMRRRHYSTIRPHSSLGYKPPALEAVLPVSEVPANAML
jgi:hypothetical protein